jgi:diguanylate cyclase (GGDEF)-like protein
LEISVTVSIGVASYPGVKALREVELVEYADKSLYYAKKNGRNQVILYNRNISYKKA